MIAAGAVATAFLAALGSWLFSLVRPVLDQPFEPEQLTAYVDDAEQECDSYSLPASLLEDVPATPVDDGTGLPLASFDGSWIVEHGGLPTVSQSIDVERILQLTLHGRGDETVVVHDIELVDFEPLVPDDDMAVIHECPPRGGDMGGAMDVSALAVDFAGQPPTLELADPELRFPYEVSKADPEVFDILISDDGMGDEEACFCRWNLQITWSAGAGMERTRIEGEGIGVATGIPFDAWQDYWFVDGEWTTEPVDR